MSGAGVDGSPKPRDKQISRKSDMNEHPQSEGSTGPVECRNPKPGISGVGLFSVDRWLPDLPTSL